jgi:hypothetical protein
MASLVGPTSVVPGQSVVSLQCIIDGNGRAHIHHAAFTNDETTTCGDTYLRVFCDPKNLTDKSRFVGVVAGAVQPHGHHGHVTVHVSGAVTMAVVLDDIDDAKPMTKLMFKKYVDTHPSIGGGPRNMPVYTTKLDADTIGDVGTILQLGRRPCNEVRLLLAPNADTRLARRRACQTTETFGSLSLDDIAAHNKAELNTALVSIHTALSILYPKFIIA